MRTCTFVVQMYDCQLTKLFNVKEKLLNHVFNILNIFLKAILFFNLIVCVMIYARNNFRLNELFMMLVYDF